MNTSGIITMSNSSERLADVIIIDGPPGSGKGLLSSHYICENPTTQHISAGQQVRSIRAGEVESAYSTTVLECLVSRQYLPDEVFGDIVLEEISRAPESTDLSLVDGFPHNSGDFDYVQERLRESGRRILGAVCLGATFDTCVARMSYRGMRGGEDVRKNAVFSATEDEKEYYAGRYSAYLEAKGALLDILMTRGVQLESIDANLDILDQEGRQIVLSQFTQGITSLKANNVREV